MATLHALTRTDRDAIGQQLALLRTAIEAGAELGPRGHHIRALSASLAGTLEALRHEAKRLPGVLRELAAHGVPGEAMDGLEERLAETLRLAVALTEMAATYPSDASPDRPSASTETARAAHVLGRGRIRR